ncbi:MAG: DUF5615 family PIN-like protein [Chloroflexi bacterium]|nr:DUF5615 family PIN-like protein [Chloroflexota bacterium]
MRILLDHDVYAATARFLKRLEHEVVSAAEAGCAQETDLKLLKTAHAQNRLFLTRDRDFGRLVFVEEIGSGVIYLRVLPSTLQEVHKQLEIVLRSYTESDLKKAFVVIEPGRHRFRKLLS